MKVTVESPSDHPDFAFIKVVRGDKVVFQTDPGSLVLEWVELLLLQNCYSLAVLGVRGNYGSH